MSLQILACAQSRLIGLNQSSVDFNHIFYSLKIVLSLLLVMIIANLDYSFRLPILSEILKLSINLYF